VVEKHDTNRYIGTEFNDDIEKTTFLESLRETGYIAFVNVSSVSVSFGDERVSPGIELRVLQTK
jgi:hypothetical protein